MQSRDELIDHWADIAAAVFKAEDSLPESWNEKLVAAKTMPEKERNEICDGYVRAIAEEIVEHSGLVFEEEVTNEKMKRAVDIIRQLFDIDILGKSRFREVCDMRIVFCYRMRKEGYTLNEIGKFIGLDHSTVHHNSVKMKDVLEVPMSYPVLVERYNKFCEIYDECETEGA